MDSCQANIDNHNSQWEDSKMKMEKLRELVRNNGLMECEGE
jgi:hypothetical protein